MKLSIIIPCFNIGKYIDRCLNSLIEQEDFEEIEVLVINDGSTDNLAKIIKSYLIKFKNIKYLYKENTGLSDTRNIGIIESRGKYIMFLDADDYLEKNFYKEIKDKLDKNIEVFNFGHRQVDSNYKLIKNYFINKNILVLDDFINNSFLTSACTKIIKKDFLLKNNIFFLKDIWYEDVNFVLKLVSKTQKIYNFSEIYYNYFQRKGSITKTYTNKILDIFVCLDDLNEFFYINNIKIENYKINKEYGQIHHYSRLVRVKKKDRKEIYIKTICYWKKYGINNIFLEKLLFIDCIYLKGIFGRSYFKILKKKEKQNV